jgi:hypothetical protein
MNRARVLPFPQDKAYELSLLKKGAPFDDLRSYLRPYLRSAIEGTHVIEAEQDRLLRELDAEVTVAAERYLASDATKQDYKFSTYFGWYLSQRLP